LADEIDEDRLLDGVVPWIIDLSVARWTGVLAIAIADHRKLIPGGPSKEFATAK
jgi:hypothetical protein